MIEARKCPDCGGEIPEITLNGLCPKCVVALASNPVFAEDEEPESERRFGDYELLGEIASGGMGVVFRARQTSLNRIVAVKMIRAGQSAHSAEIQRFRTEAEAAANLDHPNIVPIYEIGSYSGQYYFSMKLIEGPSLADEMGGGKWRVAPPDARAVQREIAGLLAKVARAVHHAHQRGVLHRDLKPSNILLDDYGEPHLTDFGLAKLTRSETELTRTVAVMGTIGYMAPEQAAGKSRQITTSADLYSLGAILFELLTGRVPFEGENSLQVLRDVMEQEPPNPWQLNAQVDRDLETICLKCLEKSPGRRYASALELAEDLERWQRDEPIRARPSSGWERTAKWIKRRPVQAALVGVIVAATIVTAVLLAYAWSQGRRAHLASSQATEAVGQVQVQKVRDFFETENPAFALAHLARILRKDPGNVVAAARLMAALSQRSFPLPAGELTHDGLVRSAHFSRDGQHVVSASDDRTARVWDTATVRLLQALTGHGDAVLSANLSTDGSRIVTASKDRTARIWKTATGELLRELKHDWWVRSAQFSPEGERVLTVASNAVAVWNALTGALLFKREVFGAHARDAQFSPDGQRVAAASQDGTALVWDARSGEVLVRLDKHERAVRMLSFSTDGRRIVTASGDFTARVWDAESGRTLVGPIHHDGPVTCVAFSADGRWIVTASEDGTARVWDAKTGAAVSELFRHSAQVRSAIFFPGGAHVLTAADDGTARLWDIASGQAACEPIRHAEFVEWAEASADGQRIITVSSDQTVRVWQVPAPQQVVGPIASPEDTRLPLVVSNLHVWKPGSSETKAFAPDGRTWVRASGTAARISDSVTGKLITELHHKRDVNSAGFSPDGQRVVTAAADQTLHVWDARSGEPLIDPIGTEMPVWDARFTLCGRWIVARTDTGPVMWEMPVAAGPAPVWLAELGEAVAGVRLDDQEAPRPIGAARLTQLRERLLANADTNSYAIWGRWFAADPRKRPVSPSAK